MGFRDSDPRIYKQMRIKGEMGKIAKRDIVSQLKPIENMGFRWNKQGKLSKPIIAESVMTTTPWCHTRHLPSKNCGLDHQITWNAFGIIHPRCMSCWKTVVTPKNFDELMKWKRVQDSVIPFACKCGIELRDYTPKHYGAYHYANSLDEGREQYEKCKALAKEFLSEETADKVILKRGCTEYEMVKGPASHWHNTEVEQGVLQNIEQYVDISYPGYSNQPEFVKYHIMMSWLLWAHMNGDFSYLPYNDDTPLFPDYQKFHEGDIQGIKHDLAICNAAVHGVPPETTEAFLEEVDALARHEEIDTEKFGYAFGADKKSPYNSMNFKDVFEIREEVIGEDNEFTGV
jgi:hypothetical protein